MAVSFLSGKVVYVSPQGSSLLRCKPEGLQGTVFSELLAPQDVSTFYSGTAPCRLPPWASCMGSGEEELWVWFFFKNKIVRALSDSSSISSQRLLRSTAPRRSPCSAGSAPTGRRTARCATSRSASRPTSSPSETRTPPSRSPAASSSPRRSTLDTRVFCLHFPLC